MSQKGNARRLVLGASLALACQAPTQDAPRAAIENTPAAGLSSQPEPMVDLHERAADERYAFGRITDVGIRQDNGLIVIDNQATRVALFDSLGRHTRDVGGKGAGPGEFRSVLSASTFGDTLAIWDAFQRRVSVFVRDSVFVGSVRITTGNGARPIRPDRAGIFVEAETGQAADTATARSEIVLVPWNGGAPIPVVPAYAVPELGWNVVSGESGHLVPPPVFTGYPAWNVSDGELFFVPAEGNEIRTYDRFRPEPMIIRIPLHRVAVTRRHKAEYFASLQRTLNASSVQMNRERAAAVFADSLPAVSHVIVDEHQRLWWGAYTPSTLTSGVGGDWVALSDEGEYLMSCKFPTGFRLLDIRGNRAAGVFEYRETGVESVRVYDVRSACRH